MDIESALWKIKCRMKGRNWKHNLRFPPSFRVCQENDHLEFKTLNGNSTSGVLAQTMEDTQSGECNLLLSGPSINTLENPSLLGKRYTIAVNGSPELLLKYGVTCNAYVVSDRAFLRRRTMDFLRYARCAGHCFLPYDSIMALLNTGVQIDDVRICVFDRSKRPFHKYRRIWKDPYFARSFSYGLGSYETIAYIALQVAYCLGFRKVYIFGMDLSLEGRFYQEEQKEPQRLHKRWDTGIIEPLTLVGNMVAKGEWTVINCSPDSRLPESILPKMDPNQALSL